MYKRRGIITNTIALVLAFTMPMCCCALKNIFMPSNSCCSTTSQVVEDATACEMQSSCCSSESENSNSEKDKTPCSDDCGNCIQDTILTQDWSPPVDTIGTDIPDYFQSTIAELLVTATTTTSGSIHGPPKFDPHLLGYSSAPAIRGSLILQV
jgi:hypothetical protein